MEDKEEKNKKKRSIPREGENRIKKEKIHIYGLLSIREGHGSIDRYI